MKQRPFLAHDNVFGNFCDDRVCACVVSVLINSTDGRKFVTGNGFSDTDFLHCATTCGRPMLLFAYFGDFSLRMHSFDRISTCSQNVTSYLNSAHSFSYIMIRSFPARNIVLGDFCDDNPQ